MFSEAHVQRNLDRLEAGLGFRPVFHSVEEVDGWTARLADAFERQKNGSSVQIRDLTRSEQDFIRNERLCCAASCEYFLTRYYWIKSKNEIFRFNFRGGQRVLWRMTQKLDDMGRTKTFQVLKARKLGISTYFEGVCAWEVLFVPGAQAQVGSCDAQKTEIMFGMILFAMSQLPPWLPPTQTRAKVASARGLMEFRLIGSTVVIQPGSMRGGMGQGDSPTFFHLSEVSQFPSPISTVEEGLLRALEPSPALFGGLESTGDIKNKNAMWWKNLWVFNRDNYWKQGSGSSLLPVFLPWFTTPELYPGRAWMADHPIPESWQPNPKTMETVAKAELYVERSEMLRQVIGPNWRMPLEQQWYWEMNYESARARKVEKSWIRQMPNDDDEALIGNFEKIYDQETIELLSRSSKHEFRAFKISGTAIRPVPSRAVKRPGATLTARWPKAGMSFTFEPVSLFEGDEGLGSLMVYEPPLPGHTYSLAVDTSGGVGRDRFVVEVTRKGEPDVQAAEFASDRVPEGDSYAYVLALAALYGEYAKEHPIIIIEITGSHGDLTVHRVRQAGAWNFYLWGKGFTKRVLQEHPGQRPDVGWKMSAWSRQLLTGAFQSAVRGAWYEVRSPWAASELQNIEEHTTESGQSRADHPMGEHDDRAIAMAMGYWALHDSDDMARMESERCRPEDTIILPDVVIEHGRPMVTGRIHG